MIEGGAVRACLNVGCGTKPRLNNMYNEVWWNVDMLPLEKVCEPSNAHLIQYRECDLRDGIPFVDGVFDYLLCDNVLEHFDNEHAINLLNEMDRVLKVGGSALIIVPDARSQAAFQDPTHRSFWVPRSALYWNQYTTPYGGARVGITANFETVKITEHGDRDTEAFITFELRKTR